MLESVLLGASINGLIPKGSCEIRDHVPPVPGSGNELSDVGTGWNGSKWSPEAEDILQNTLLGTRHTLNPPTTMSTPPPSITLDPAPHPAHLKRAPSTG